MEQTMLKLARKLKISARQAEVVWQDCLLLGDSWTCPDCQLVRYISYTNLALNGTPLCTYCDKEMRYGK